MGIIIGIVLFVIVMAILHGVWSSVKHNKDLGFLDMDGNHQDDGKL